MSSTNHFSRSHLTGTNTRRGRPSGFSSTSLSRQTQHPSSLRYFDQYSPERQQTRQPPSFPAHSFETSDQPPLKIERNNRNKTSHSGRYGDSSFNAQSNIPDQEAPRPPPHRHSFPAKDSIEHTTSQPPAYQATGDPALRARSLGYTRSFRSISTTTPGADNLGDTAAGGGIAGIAYGVARANERESGLQALQALQEAQAKLGTRPDSMSSSREDNPYVPEPSSGYMGRGPGQARPAAAMGAIGGQAYSGRTQALAPAPSDQHLMSHFGNQAVDPFGSQASLSSDMPRDAFAGGLGPQGRSGGRPPSGTWIETPHQRRDDLWDSNFDPNEIADDGADDALHGPARTGRRSMYPGIAGRSHSSLGPVAGGAGLGATVAGLGNRTASGKYGPVGQNTEYIGGHDENEKDWDLDQASKRKKRFWIAMGIGALIIAIIVGAVVGGVYGSRAHAGGGGTGGSSSSADKDDGTILNSDSSSIKSLMNDNRLHRVFPGIAYTPLNAQYPACLSNMPIQNNVTKDVAVLSQLTDTIRLYGTDCNQTEMVLEAFDLLKITDMKVWLAVWLENNSTTNDRGLNAMHDLLKKYGSNPFKGVILGNEVLFRKDLTTTQILEIVSETRSNFSANSIDLPIAIADLGDNWTANMAQAIDVVMSNVHPFFGGVPVDQAAGWAWDFWTTHDVVLTQGNTTKQNIISEIGWPSGGGNDCGTSDGKCSSTTEGAVANIANMNTFMEEFVCQSITNKTDYFWFEAFDEPWKAIFNTDNEKWETQWGLFDQYRNLKDNVTIPTCGGQKPSY